MCTIWKEKYCHWLLQHIQHGKNTFTWMSISCSITLYLPLFSFTVMGCRCRVEQYVTRAFPQDTREFKNKRNVAEDVRVCCFLGGERHHAHSSLAGFSKEPLQLYNNLIQHLEAALVLCVFA